MTRTLFILGAGASFPTGAPLMSQFLRKIRDIERDLSGEPFESDFQLVLRAYNELQPTRVKIRMSYEANIEHLLASFEMARMVKWLGTLTERELEMLPNAMRRAISSTIELSMPFPIQDLSYAPHAVYSTFVSLIDDFQKNIGPDIGIITFNYDLGLDFALTYHHIRYDYHVMPTTGRVHLAYLKLHGSLNWAQCSTTKKVVPISLQPYLAPLRFRDLPNTFPLQVSLDLAKADGCGGGVEPVPFIIPPTWNKTEYHSQVANVWKHAVNDLTEAEKIYIIGYSLPEFDEFFRHLLAIGLTGDAILDKLCVVDPLAGPYERLKAFS